MKNLIIVCFAVLFTGILTACAQQERSNHHHKIDSMDTSKLTNKLVKEAIDAWQQGDAKKWLSFFEPNSELLDDGHPRDFHQFSTEAIGHERFTSIDKVEDNGFAVYGKFHSDTWGDFRTYFRFRLGANGKFDQLEIGQAN